MTVEQLYTNCLSEAAYFIESDGEAVVIDPIRDYHTYIQLAEKKNCKIKYIFETHFHADFVSGHIDLAKATGAPIIYGPETKTNYPVTIAKEGDIFKIGKATIEIIHTPGHTPESTCYLLKDEEGKPYSLFTGDTLFVGDVGRPDLFGTSITKEQMADRMYDSLEKIKQLPDDLLIYPAHGPGSSCGKNIGKETWSTLGIQKKMNPALKTSSREEFIELITNGLSAPPQYFALNAAINKEGYQPLDEVLSKNTHALSVLEFEKEIKNGSLILDTRPQSQFEDGFIPGSLFIGLSGRFAEWVGSLIDIDQPVILVCEPGKEDEAILRMARVGYENVKGFLVGGFESWKNAGKQIDLIVSIDNEEFEIDYKFDQINVVDVRKESEFMKGHVKDAHNIPLQDFHVGASALTNEEPIYIHCEGGYRSVIATSLLKQRGIYNVKNISGGYNSISKSNVPLVSETQSV